MVDDSLLFTFFFSSSHIHFEYECRRVAVLPPRRVAIHLLSSTYLSAAVLPHYPSTSLLTSKTIIQNYIHYANEGFIRNNYSTRGDIYRPSL